MAESACTKLSNILDLLNNATIATLAGVFATALLGALGWALLTLIRRQTEAKAEARRKADRKRAIQPNFSIISITYGGTRTYKGLNQKLDLIIENNGGQCKSIVISNDLTQKIDQLSNFGSGSSKPITIEAKDQDGLTCSVNITIKGKDIDRNDFEQRLGIGFWDGEWHIR